MSEPTIIEQATDWLEKWASIGGGVTIAASGLLHPWRTSPSDEQKMYPLRSAKAEIAERLLIRLITTPDLHQPIRVILNTKARGMAAPFLKGQKP